MRSSNGRKSRRNTVALAGPRSVTLATPSAQAEAGVRPNAEWICDMGPAPLEPAPLEPGCVGPLARLHALEQTTRRNTRAKRLHRRRGQPRGSAISGGLPQDFSQTRLFPLEVDIVDRCLDLGVNFRIELPSSFFRSRFSGQEGGCYRIPPETIQKPIDATVAETELARGLGDQMRLETGDS
jgi:hypothetical protein